MSDPFHPREIGSVRIGGIVGRVPHPARPDQPLAAEGGGITFDERFFLEGDAFRGRRPHQVRLQGGDASSDSYCYPPD